MLCEDQRVLGATFYVMERRRGVVVRSEEPPQLADQPQQRKRVSKAIVDVLADLHLVDIRAHGLDALGKPSGFVTRQVQAGRNAAGSKRVSKRNERAIALAFGSTATDRLEQNVLPGDYKLDKVMLIGASEISRVFDWEMSAVGDPLRPRHFYAYWVPRRRRATVRECGHDQTRRVHREVIARYAARTQPWKQHQFRRIRGTNGRGAATIFYRTTRETDDPRFATLDKRVEMLSQIATKLAAES